MLCKHLMLHHARIGRSFMILSWTFEHVMIPRPKGCYAFLLARGTAITDT